MSSSLFQKWTLRRSVARPPHSGNTGSDPAVGAANLTVTSNKPLITSRWSIHCVPTCHISLRQALSHYDRADLATVKVQLQLNNGNKAGCARERSIQQTVFLKTYHHRFHFPGEAHSPPGSWSLPYWWSCSPPPVPRRLLEAVSCLENKIMNAQKTETQPNKKTILRKIRQRGKFYQLGHDSARRKTVSANSQSDAWLAIEPLKRTSESFLSSQIESTQWKKTNPLRVSAKQQKQKQRKGQSSFWCIFNTFPCSNDETSTAQQQQETVYFNNHGVLNDGHSYFRKKSLHCAENSLRDLGAAVWKTDYWWTTAKWWGGSASFNVLWMSSAPADSLQGGSWCM